MKKAILLLIVLLVLALLMGCKTANDAAALQQGSVPPVSPEAASEAGIDSPSPSASVDPLLSEPVLPAGSPAASQSPVPASGAEENGANQKNKQELKKKVNDLEEELAELKDLFDDIDFEGLNDF